LRGRPVVALAAAFLLEPLANFPSANFARLLAVSVVYTKPQDLASPHKPSTWAGTSGP
jgi:hypothetical protein